MSHFNVMIAGNDIDEQLAPFHEFECTGFNDQYVQDVDITEEAIEKGLDYFGLEYLVVDDESKVDKNGDHKYGYAIVKNDKIIKAVNRTNPNRQWDWWVIGGRWSNYFLLKNGERADSALKKDIDFEGMMQEARLKARARYTLAMQTFGSYLSDFIPWQNIPKDDINEARSFYHAQAAVKAKHIVRELIWHDVEEFLVAQEEYENSHALKAVATFAFIKDSTWNEKGSMGWWGVVSDEKEENSWLKCFNAFLGGVADDELLTIVDCHI